MLSKTRCTHACPELVITPISPGSPPVQHMNSTSFTLAALTQQEQHLCINVPYKHHSLPPSAPLHSIHLCGSCKQETLTRLQRETKGFIHICQTTILPSATDVYILPEKNGHVKKWHLKESQLHRDWLFLQYTNISTISYRKCVSTHVVLPHLFYVKTDKSDVFCSHTHLLLHPPVILHSLLNIVPIS